VKATIHWLSAGHSLPAEVRLYDRLFRDPDPEAGEDFIANLNPNSLEVLTQARVEPSLLGATPGRFYQFERLGYFSVDSEATQGQLIFNRTVSLKDDWAKVQARQ
jgi:glutaminyl-tRNA synthetase